MVNKVIIEVRINEYTMRDQNPHVPYSLEEIAILIEEDWAQSIQPSLDTRSFVRWSRRSVCSSKAILATEIHQPRSRTGSGGWSTWSPSSMGSP